jgi:hypothetical protein
MMHLYEKIVGEEISGPAMINGLQLQLVYSQAGHDFGV